MSMAGRAFDKDLRDIVAQGEELFSKRLPLLSLWQEVGDNFYPERADFTVGRNFGEDFAGHLTTSYPIIARRDLGNAFASMLRPTEKEWFHIKTQQDPDETGRQWLEWATETQRRAMYDRASLFTRATAEGDHDYAAFGQCVLSVEVIYPATGPQYLYRCWHLRDVAWAENAYGSIDTVHRKWKPTARNLAKLFRGNVHEKVTKALEKEPHREFECRHIIIPSEDWKRTESEGTSIEARQMRAKAGRFPFVSLYVDCENEWVMEETPLPYSYYIIPRWQTVSGSQYAFSPATVAALPDARLLQEMAFTLLNAGQKAVDPPMIAVQEAIRSDVQIFAGGITWADAEYDERLGEVLRPLSQDTSGIPLGLEMSQDTRMQIAEAFFLNKLNMPQNGPEMTAYEVGQRIQEFIRNALPLFGPMEMDYNGQICEATFELGLRHGMFGSPQNIPRSLQGQDIQFRFESPLHDALEAQKAEVFMRTRQMIELTAPVDPLAVRMVDWRTALRDALHGGSTPAAWLRTEEDMLAIEQAEAEKAAVAELMQQVSAGAQVAEQVGNAGQALNGMDQMAQQMPQMGAA